MRILIIGGGGRGHALAWKVAQSPRVTQVFVAPGNAGSEREPKTGNIDIRADDIAALLDFARRERIDLTIAGPEAVLVAGVGDAFTAAGLKLFGPSRAAAQLEGSKAFAKAFLSRHRIPTARFQTFTELEQARFYIRAQGAPIVIKADGLAAGKGVVVAQTEAEALAAAESMLTGAAVGAAGKRIVVEECLAGEEASFIVMVDGEQVLPLASSQDHKARDDGDRGPNTGGMGAYSPAPVVTPALAERIMREIIHPTVRGLLTDGCHYRGFLYAGLMVAGDGSPKVLEYNCRLGDPETQPLMMRLRTDLIELCEAALEGRLHRTETQWDARCALGVVMAAQGYPGVYRKGDAISGLDEADGEAVKVFHAGTARAGNAIVTNGGRVLCVTALGEGIAEAQRRAYQTVGKIHWPRAFCRTDIGYRALLRP
ncbi:MAG: phosphoribosylamine--glycine ligase [Gammaproteobacteria bacterium]